MKKKILLALLIVVILLGAGVAYAYFATDVFRTEKEMFFSYLLTDDMWSSLQDENVTKYVEKQKNIAYTNKGEITLNIEGEGFTTEDETIEMLNKSKVTFEGNTDNRQKSAEQTITVDFSQGFNIPIKLKKDGETFGIQSDFLDSKYIAVRNENLKALLERFDIDAEEIPDKIAFTQEQFTEKELKVLKERYLTILNDNLGEELFSKEKLENQTIITLRMSEEKCVDLLVKILERVRNDELILSKISGIYEISNIQNEIDEMISDLKEMETSEANIFEMKLYVEAKEIKKCEMTFIEDNETTMIVTIEKFENQVTIKMYEGNNIIAKFSMEKETRGNDVTYNVAIKINDEDLSNIELNFKMQYKNVLALDNVEENYEIQMSTVNIDEYAQFYEEKTEVTVNYKNLKTFDQSIEIEGLNKDNAIILNDATDDEIQNLMILIYKNLGLM